MTRDFAADPEAEADRRRRDAAPIAPAIDELQHNDPRLARLKKLYDVKPEPVVESWPCRTGCSARVDMTATAIARVVDSNRLLASRGERPLSKREVMLCADCRASWDAEAAEKCRQRHQAIAALTRELRHGVLPWREAAIADELRGLGADAQQILREVAQANESKAPTSARRNSL